MKLEKDVCYITTNKKEDLEFRQKLHDMGYRWFGGQSLLTTQYFNEDDGGHYGLAASEDDKVIWRAISAPKQVYVKDLMKGEKEMDWKKYAVEARTPEEAYEKWRKGLTVDKEEKSKNEFNVKVEGNKTIITFADGTQTIARCNPEDEFDVAEGVKVALEKTKIKKKRDAIVQMLKTLGCKSLWKVTYDDDDKDECFQYHVIGELEDDDDAPVELCFHVDYFPEIEDWEDLYI